MSYAKSTDDGTTFAELGIPRNVVESTIGVTLSPDDIDGYTSYGYFRQVNGPYSGPPSCLAGYEPVPVLVGLTAEFPAIQSGEAECSVSERERLQSAISGQVPETMPRDPELAASAQDKADQAETALIALRDTADADLESFDPDLALYLPSASTLSLRLADQGLREIAKDDARVLSGSSNSLAPSDRADLDGWTKDVDEGGTSEPPTEVRQDIRVPLEDHGTMLIERAEFVGDASGTHGFRYTMKYDDPELAGVISLRIYDSAGVWLGYSINFAPTSDPSIQTDVTPPGFYTPVPLERQHEEFAGAASISRKFTIRETEKTQSAPIRWGGEHVGTQGTRKGRKKPPRRR